jgi:hypothetical protein
MAAATADKAKAAPFPVVISTWNFSEANKKAWEVGHA